MFARDVANARYSQPAAFEMDPRRPSEAQPNPYSFHGQKSAAKLLRRPIPWIAYDTGCAPLNKKALSVATWRERLVMSFLRLAGILSLRQAQRLGAALGAVFMMIPNSLKTTAARNISLCFRESSDIEREALLRAHLVEFGKTVCEVPLIWKITPEVLKKVVTETSGAQDLTQALNAGHGVVIAAPHLGAWELVGLFCSQLAPMTSLYRPPQLAALDEPIRRARERFGARLVPTDKRGVRALLDALNRGEMIGILPDQDPGRDNGVFAPFFGLQANSMTLLTRLVARKQTAVFVTFAERLPNAKGYRLHFRRLESGQYASIEQGVAALNEAIVAAIRLAPAQYLWTYKRFKTRPPGEKPLY